MTMTFLLNTGDYFPAFPVGWASGGGGRPWAAVGRDRPIMPGWHGHPALPHATANYVWKTFLQVQV